MSAMQQNALVEPEQVPSAAYSEIGRAKRRCVEMKSLEKAINYVPRKKKARQESNIRMTTDDTEDCPDRNDWICGCCGLSEAFDGSDLVLCDGPCLRSFHLGCLDQRPDLIAAVQQPQWFCDECGTGRHSCFVCGIEGDDEKDVKKCMMGRCGKYYHWNCVQEYIYRVPAPSKRGAVASAADETPKRGEEEEQEGIPRFKCPRHFCDVCNAEYEKELFGKLFPCVKCPRAYHLNCIPLSCRTTSLSVMCARHPYDKMPDKELSGKKEAHGLTSLFFSQMSIPEQRSGDKKLFGTNFLLPIDIKEAVANHEPEYNLIWKLDYSTLVPRSADGSEPTAAQIRERMPPLQYADECCNCEDVCDEKCLNRYRFMFLNHSLGQTVEL